MSLLNNLFGFNEKKDVFISFSIEDRKYRDFLVNQAKNDKSPFVFTDMSVKKAWSESIWQEKCKERINNCDAVIVLLSNNTWHSSGVRWEIKCAKELGIDMIGMRIYKNADWAIPPELKGIKVINWNWNELDRFLK